MPKNKGYSQQSSKPTANRTAGVVRDRLAQETGTIRKDRGGRIPVALVFPNTYYIGMSSLGFQTIYKLFNEAPDVVCERAFLPDTDGQFEMPRNRRRSAAAHAGRRAAPARLSTSSPSRSAMNWTISTWSRSCGRRASPCWRKDRDRRRPDRHRRGRVHHRQPGADCRLPRRGLCRRGRGAGARLHRRAARRTWTHGRDGGAAGLRARSRGCTCPASTT